MRPKGAENLLFLTTMLEPPLEPAPSSCEGGIELVHLCHNLTKPI